MAKPSLLNPLYHIIERQYSDGISIKNRLFKERLAHAKNLFRKDLLAHYGCVNAIEFSWEGDLLVSGGDDRRVLLWSIPESMYGRGSPVAMDTNHVSNIFCLAFDSTNSKIFSGGNDDQVIIHDTNTGSSIGKLAHKKPVYGLSVNPQNDYVLATAGDDGRILLFDVRESNNIDALCLAKQKTGFHSVMFNPTNPRWLTTANAEEGIALWDCRKPKEILIHYDANSGPISGISACFNSAGTRVLALRRRLPPVLYATEKENAICQFYHPHYYNSCTMKTCCFAGEEDEYVLSGSDDFNLYCWKTPTDESEWGMSHVVLKGHRSIVNQVRYNKQNNLIASSGVEKMIKLWSTMPIGTWEGALQKELSESLRSVYSHDDYIYLVGHTGERISHDYSDQSTLEDSKMLAFFDSLIQREIEGWESQSETEFSDSESDEREKSVAHMLSEMFSTNKTSNEDNRKQKSNRIAQLIAKKRSRLARMAHGKSTSQVLKYKLRESNRKRKNLQKMKACAKLKKNGLSKKSQSTNKNGVDSECHKRKFSPERCRARKYRTRQSLKDTYDSSTSNSFDAPSTSTGITSSNNSVYRVIEQDSDDDVPANNCTENGESEVNNFVNILPTPLNGTHDMYINVLEMTRNMTNTNVVTVRNEDYNNQASTSHSSREFFNVNVFPSGSNNGNLNCVSASGDNCSVGDLLQTDSFNNTYFNEHDSDTDYEYDYHTPVKKRRTVSASDSGCGTGPSSNSPYSIRNPRNHQECSSNDRYSNEGDPENEYYESIKKRIKDARMNLSKQIGGDSDSN